MCMFLHVQSSMSDLRKLKKQRRTQLQLLNQDDVAIEFLDEPSLFVYIANGGVAMGISRDLLWHVLSSFSVVKIITPSRKQYAFATFSSLSETERVVSTINGCSIQVLCQHKSLLTDYLSSGPPISIYLSYISAIPNIFTTEQEKCQVNISVPLGLLLIPNFISEAEEKLLLKFFSFADDKNDAGDCGFSSNVSLPKTELKQRKVMHYGYEFNYATNNVDPTKPLPGGLPEICTPVVAKMMRDNLITNEPDQLTVNRYLPGQGNKLFIFYLFICNYGNEYRKKGEESKGVTSYSARYKMCIYVHNIFKYYTLFNISFYIF